MHAFVDDLCAYFKHDNLQLCVSQSTFSLCSLDVKDDLYLNPVSNVIIWSDLISLRISAMKQWRAVGII